MRELKRIRKKVRGSRMFRALEEAQNPRSRLVREIKKLELLAQNDKTMEAYNKHEEAFGKEFYPLHVLTQTERYVSTLYQRTSLSDLEEQSLHNTFLTIREKIFSIEEVCAEMTLGIAELLKRKKANKVSLEREHYHRGIFFNDGGTYRENEGEIRTGMFISIPQRMVETSLMADLGFVGEMVTEDEIPSRKSIFCFYGWYVLNQEGISSYENLKREGYFQDENKVKTARLMRMLKGR